MAGDFVCRHCGQPIHVETRASGTWWSHDATNREDCDITPRAEPDDGLTAEQRANFTAAAERALAHNRDRKADY